MDKRGKKIAGTMLYVPGVLLMVLGIIYLPITASMSLAVAAALGGAAMTAAGLYLNHSHKTKTLTARTVRYVLLSLGAVIMMFPFLLDVIFCFQDVSGNESFSSQHGPQQLV